MNLTVLGCGDAFGSDGRYNTSFLLDDGDEYILIDCGATTLVRLKQLNIDINTISTIVISHFHGDHYGGLPFVLICSLFETKRSTPLTIVGPEGVKERVLSLQEVMYPGTSERLAAMDLKFVAYKEGDWLKLGNKNILAYKVEHSPPSIPHGVRLEWNEKVFAFSGDTSWTDNLPVLSKGADLFICECNFYEHQDFGHLSYMELLDKKAQLECNNIWLTHMGREVIDLEEDLAFNKLRDGMQIPF